MIQSIIEGERKELAVDGSFANLDLNLLLVLHTVLEERSVARAARRLHVTSPAVSNSLARLRALLGDPLLVRDGRGLTPTPRALELGEVLARTMAELEGAVVGSGDFDPASTTREFTLALSDGDQVASLPRLARAFGASMPRARLRVVSIDALLSQGGLAGSDVDVAFGPPGSGEDLHAQLLYEEEAAFVVRRDHPRVGERLTRGDFGAERHVDIHLALGRAGAGNRAARAALDRHGLSRDVAVVVPTFTAAAFVAAGTDLVAGIPRRIAEALVATLPIRIVRSPLPKLTLPMYMLWHERTQHDPGATHFREVIVEVVTERGATRSTKEARRKGERPATKRHGAEARSKERRGAVRPSARAAR